MPPAKQTFPTLLPSMIKRSLSAVGEYALLLKRIFDRPTKHSMLLKQLVREIYKYGVDSIWIVIIISFFIGMVMTIQLSINIKTPLVPRFTIGYSVREVMLLEFSSSIMCLILAGKVGSSIASELATMRVTEQIDAMEIMGINSANFLILPKILGLMLFIPVLSIISMSIGLLGAYLAAFVTPDVSPWHLKQGMQLFFMPYSVWYSIIKSLVFAFLIASVSGYFGYTVKGGALGVGKASTDAVVTSSVLILLFDVLLTNLLLA